MGSVRGVGQRGIAKQKPLEGFCIKQQAHDISRVSTRGWYSVVFNPSVPFTSHPLHTTDSLYHALRRRCEMTVLCVIIASASSRPLQIFTPTASICLLADELGLDCEDDSSCWTFH
eukprot:3404257-Amphidinium_carterae.1